jgi:hypothetical protein
MPKSKTSASAAKQAKAPALPVAWIYDHRELRPHERLVLLSMADHADPDGWFRGCIEELARWTGLLPTEVEAHRLDLIGRRLLEYTDEPEKDAPERDCDAYWCTPEMRDEHPQRVKPVEPRAGEEAAD